MSAGATHAPRMPEEPESSGAVGHPGNREDFLGAAHLLGRAIAERRLFARDGSITWQRPNRSTEAGAPPLVPAGPHLYDGLAGIALLFAALGRTGRDEGYRDLSLEIVAPLRRLLRRLVVEPERARRMRLGIGGQVGVCSFVHALVNLGRLLELPELFAEAHRVVGLVTPEHVAADSSLDVVTGCAGAILALLTIDRYIAGPTPSGATPLEVAGWCADHLLSRRMDRADGATCWPTDPRFPPLTGFAHGSAGISCALLKLYARTGRRDLLDTALRGWAFERSTFDDERQDWIDQTSPTRRFLNQWCFGAPGIALARMATLDVVGDDTVWREIRAGLRHTSEPSLVPADHICCGDMGRSDVLIYAADKLGEPCHRVVAADLACRVLARKKERGRFHGLVRSDQRDPSFFSGEAGIAYTLLRLAFPGELPCLLAMD
jgi:lantibiotic modifying enzyme